MIRNQSKDGLRETIDDLLSYHNSIFGKEIKAEKEDELRPLDPSLSRGRPSNRFDRTDFRRRHKSPSVQVAPPRRITAEKQKEKLEEKPIEVKRQGFNMTRNPSITEIVPGSSLISPQPSYSSMTGGSNQSLSSLYSNLSRVFKLMLEVQPVIGLCS